MFHINQHDLLLQKSRLKNVYLNKAAGISEAAGYINTMDVIYLKGKDKNKGSQRATAKKAG